VIIGKSLKYGLVEVVKRVGAIAVHHPLNEVIFIIKTWITEATQ
jgi:hypothetical protein